MSKIPPRQSGLRPGCLISPWGGGHTLNVWRLEKLRLQTFKSLWVQQIRPNCCLGHFRTSERLTRPATLAFNQEVVTSDGPDDQRSQGRWGRKG